MTNPASIPPKRRGHRAATRIVLTTAAAAAFVAAGSLSASAAPGQTAQGSTEANVEVSSAISLSALSPSFTLAGLPGATVATDADADPGDNPVTMNVSTNNTAGYSVTVRAADSVLAPANTAANPDTIPINALTVKNANDADYLPLSDTATVPVGGSATRSAAGGDVITNDYQLTIPFVNSDTYSVTLDYVATTL